METNVKDIHYYLSLPYTYEIVQEDESTWFARVRELPGCMTEGDNAVEALNLLKEAQVGWLEVALKTGYPIPEPRASEEYSGKFNLRIPRSLHRDLVDAANRENVSLNQFVGTELARAVGSKLRPSETAEPGAQPERR